MESRKEIQCAVNRAIRHINKETERFYIHQSNASWINGRLVVVLEFYDRKTGQRTTLFEEAKSLLKDDQKVLKNEMNFFRNEVCEEEK